MRLVQIIAVQFQSNNAVETQPKVDCSSVLPSMSVSNITSSTECTSVSCYGQLDYLRNPSYCVHLQEHLQTYWRPPIFCCNVWSWLYDMRPLYSLSAFKRRFILHKPSFFYESMSAFNSLLWHESQIWFQLLSVAHFQMERFKTKHRFTFSFLIQAWCQVFRSCFGHSTVFPNFVMMPCSLKLPAAA